MTPDQVKLVQDSFAKVVPIADTAAELFYGRLFEIAPQVRAMFPADMSDQRRKLMMTLMTVVNGLGNLDTILPAARALAKRHVGYTSTTGDDFALIAPVSIGLGRVGCLLHGCCLGMPWAPRWYALADTDGILRWPAVPVELAFNGLAFLTFLALRRRSILPGQHFHLYLIGYGLFRFGHECVRATPRILGPFSGYHFVALGVSIFGLICFLRRQNHSSLVTTTSNTGRPSGRPSPHLA